MKTYLRLLVATLAISLSGCVFLPIPQFGKPISGRAIQEKDWKFGQPGETTRAEVIEHFGLPSRDYPGLGVAVYLWETRDWELVFSTTGGGASESIESLHACMVQFDKGGRLVRHKIMKHSLKMRTEVLAEKWAASK